MTLGGGGCSGNTMVTVTVNTPPSVTLTGMNLCNAPLQIGTTSVAGNTYSWSPTTGLDDAFIAEPFTSVSSTTTYTLTITDANGCSESFDQTITVNAPQIAAGLDLEVCEGTAVSIGAIPAEGGATYSWSPHNCLGRCYGRPRPLLDLLLPPLIP